MSLFSSIAGFEARSVLAPERLTRLGSLGVVGAGLMAILVFML